MLEMVVVRARLRAEVAAVVCWCCCWKKPVLLLLLPGAKGRRAWCAALSLPKETLLMARLRLPLPELSPPRSVLPMPL